MKKQSTRLLALLMALALMLGMLPAAAFAAEDAAEEPAVVAEERLPDAEVLEDALDGETIDPAEAEAPDGEMEDPEEDFGEAAPAEDAVLLDEEDGAQEAEEPVIDAKFFTDLSEGTVAYSIGEKPLPNCQVKCNEQSKKTSNGVFQ